MLPRRQVLAGLAASSGMLAVGAASGPPVREDIATLARTPARLAALNAAIGDMQRRSRRAPEDPKGWRVHALAHAKVCSAVSNADDRQVHDCWWFLPWHRAFLAVTEWKLRALSGDPTLALPYWNWSSDRRIPTAFTTPGTALADAVRYTSDRALTPAEVDHLLHDAGLARLGVAALGARSFQARAPEQIPTSFGGIARPNPARWHGRSRIEGIPHAAIHNYVGGEAQDGALGDMTEFSTAALDPLFYAHHGNLDRLWEAWRLDPARKTTEPAEPAFTEQRFVFPWLDGGVVAVSVADALDTRRLGYVYDSLAVFRDGAPPNIVAVSARPPLAEATVRIPSARGGPWSLRIAGVVPSARPMTVEFALSRPGDPASSITIGALAMGRKRGLAEFPDTEPNFAIGDVATRLRSRTLTVSILPLPLGQSSSNAPPFSYTHMEIVPTQT